MTKRSFACALAMLATAFTSQAYATLTYLGTSTGDLVIHYNNNGGGEVPSNQSYISTENSASNSHGSTFNFDPNLAFPFPGYGPFHFFQAVPDQFGIDLNLVASTWDGSSPTGSSVPFYDNVDGTAANRASAGSGTWAINGYSGATGPSNPASYVANSLFRGTNVEYNITNLTQNGTVFEFDIDGRLITDGAIHWYTPSTADTPLPTPPFFDYQPFILFDGHFSYDSANDTSTNLFDRYSGTVQYYLTDEADANDPLVPEPATLGMIGLGMASLGALRRRRKQA